MFEPKLGGGVTPLLLDTYSGASAAYSLRKLRTAYTGNAITVRRSSDNTSQNIGFDANGNLDTASLLSFVGAGNGFVSVWFDQSGNSYNQTQISSALQPKIVSSGTLVTSNGMTSIQFDGVDDCLVNVGSGLGTTFSGDDVPCSILGLFDFSVSQVSVPVSFARQATSTALEQIIFQAINTTTYYAYKRDNSGIIKSYSYTPSVYGGQQLITGTSPGITMRIRRNGIAVLTDSDVNVTTITIDNLTLGALTRNTTNNYYNGKMQEVIVYNSNQQSNIVGIESNINTKYSIY